MKASRRQLFWISIVGCALVAGCAGETGGDSGGDSGGGSDGGGDGITLTASARAIFETQCADCHGAGGQGGSAPNLVTNESGLSELEGNVTRMINSKGIDCGTYGAACTDAIVEYITHSLYLKRLEPVADSSASSNLSGTHPHTINLSASRSYATSATGIFSHTWNILDEDGINIAQEVSVDWNFRVPAAGSYTAELVITDNNGRTARESLGVQVGATEANLPPIAVIRSPVSMGFVGVDVNMYGDTSIDEQRDLLAYNWDFDNGMGSTMVNPTTIYGAAGTYDVTLTLDDGEFTASVVRPLQIVSSADAIAADVYADSCARCHGSTGQGGPRSRINDGASLVNVVGMLNDYASGYPDCAGGTATSNACAQAVTDLINNVF